MQDSVCGIVVGSVCNGRDFHSCRRSTAAKSLPNLPRFFLQPILESASKTPGNPVFAEPDPADVPPPRWQPKPLVRTCVATMRPLEDFRWMVQAEAKRRHVFTDRHFPDFVPILDFVREGLPTVAVLKQSLIFKRLGRASPSQVAISRHLRPRDDLPLLQFRLPG